MLRGRRAPGRTTTNRSGGVRPREDHVGRMNDAARARVVARAQQFDQPQSRGCRVDRRKPQLQAAHAYRVVLDPAGGLRHRSRADRVQPPRASAGGLERVDQYHHHPGQQHASTADRPLASGALGGHLWPGRQPSSQRGSELGHHHHRQRRSGHRALEGGCEGDPVRRLESDARQVPHFRGRRL